MPTHEISTANTGHGAHKPGAPALPNTARERTDDETLCRNLRKNGEHGASKSSICIWGGKTPSRWIGAFRLIHGRKTGLELAQGSICLPYHAAQNLVRGHRRRANEQRQVQPLVYSSVGEDCAGGDFFEHISADSQSASDTETASAPEQAPTPTPAPTSTPTPVYDKVKADIAWPIAQPVLDAYGYPPPASTFMKMTTRAFGFTHRQPLSSARRPLFSIRKPF